MKKILILHGWAYSLDKWQDFVEQLKQAGFEAETLKVPGLTQEMDKVWGLDDYVKWLREIVDKEKQPPILLGHSNGGRIALAFAAKYPEKVDQLVLIDSAGVYHNELPIRLKRLIFKKLAQVGKKLTISSLLRSFLYKLAGEVDYKNASPNMQKTLANLISVDLTPLLKNISKKTLIIWGEKDKVTPLSDGKLMHKLINASQFFIIKQARHSPQYTHAKEIVDKIKQTIT